MAESGEFMSVRRRFKTNEQEEDDEQSSGPDEAVDVKPSARINRHSVFWILASVSLTYYLDFFSVLLNHSDIHSWWFSVALVLLALCVSLALFCMVYLEWFRGIQQYDQEYPAVPAVSTAAFIAASCSLNIALWPVWSFFTPVILFTQFMGVVMLISLLG
ncbi:transmembrane protein 128 [Sinocyclocheilus grahami]|uniref:transmembrane protein 128 n=1 Tax=Sinocyclocheilus grahami TaxID=75366 RepID=UPI0007ACE9D5|nr:PREDICTED: transmembrane protein 128 [Sinocyclocheilus grahami]XP_016111481.1 PREDICTED: transmembrane protein 128 [Sinocyclocheilus grahami]